MSNRNLNMIKDGSLEFGRHVIGVPPRYSVDLLTDPTDINDARHLVAEVYLGKEKVVPTIDPDVDTDPDHIDRELLIERELEKTDPYHPIRITVGAFDRKDESGKVVETASVLWKDGLSPFDLRVPLKKIAEESTEVNETLQDIIDPKNIGKVAEVGAFAKKDGVSPIISLKIMKTVMQFGREHGIKYLVACIEPKLFPAYKDIMGDAFEAIGDNVEFHEFSGSYTPIAINLEEAYDRQQDTERGRSFKKRIGGWFVRRYFSDVAKPTDK